MQTLILVKAETKRYLKNKGIIY